LHKYFLLPPGEPALEDRGRLETNPLIAQWRQGC
jgi:hypothetical protein